MTDRQTDRQMIDIQTQIAVRLWRALYAILKYFCCFFALFFKLIVEESLNGIHILKQEEETTLKMKMIWWYEEDFKQGWESKEAVAILQIIACIDIEVWIKAKYMEIGTRE